MMKLKEIRKERGMTQGELAKKIGTNQNNISRYEKSEREPSLSTLNKLSVALNVTLDELVGNPRKGENNDRPQPQNTTRKR